VHVSTEKLPAGPPRTRFKIRKGFTGWGFVFDAPLMTSIGANIILHDMEGQIVTSFMYGESIPYDANDTWQESVAGPATVHVYQPLLIYCTRVVADDRTRELAPPHMMCIEEDGELLFLTAVFHNMAFVREDVLDLFTLIDFGKYLLKEGAGRWYMKPFLQARGHLRHRGARRYVVASDSTGRGQDGNPLVLWENFGSQTPAGDEFNTYILTSEGHLYHQGYRKYVVAEDSTGNGGNGTALVLSDSFASQTPQEDRFNTFRRTADVRLVHQGTGLYVVAEDSTGNGGNGNRLVLWEGGGSQTPMGDTFNTFAFEGE
jgi:hypothetical protein